MRTLVAGIGSTIRCDDGVGVHVARQLKARSSYKNVDIIELGTAGLALLDYVGGYDRLIVLDAIVTGSPPGTVHELTGDEVTRTVHLGTGHEADLPTTIAWGRKLLGVHIPESVFVVAIEASDLTRFSECLTPEVEAVLPEVLTSIERLLERGAS
jgi:hydrogenase maturation protease